MSMTKNFKKGIIKYGLAIIFLSVILFSLPLSVNLSSSNQANAATWWDTAYNGGLDKVGTAYGQTSSPSETYDIRIMLARIIRRVLELLGLIFLIIIIVAGFRWMMAGGDEEKVTVSKKQLVNGVIGLIIILASYAIATYVFYQLQYTITGIQPVNWSW